MRAWLGKHSRINHGTLTASGITTRRMPGLALGLPGLVCGAEAEGVGLGCLQSELLPKALQRNGGPQANWGVDRDLLLDSEEGQNKSLVDSRAVGRKQPSRPPR